MNNLSAPGPVCPWVALRRPAMRWDTRPKVSLSSALLPYEACAVAAGRTVALRTL